MLELEAVCDEILGRLRERGISFDDALAAAEAADERRLLWRLGMTRAEARGLYERLQQAKQRSTIWGQPGSLHPERLTRPGRLTRMYACTGCGAGAATVVVW